MTTPLDVPLDDLNRITADVLNGVSPADSRLDYTDAMLEARKRIEADIAAMPDGAIVDIPNELPPVDVAG